MSEKTAVILFNLGGPDAPAAVKPFLYNLFSDRAIIGLPAGLRHALAWLISTRRAPKAAHIYAQMGGRSPILPETQKQAAALQVALREKGDYQVFPCMRYWHPRSREVVRQVRESGAKRVLLLPLYPQYSTTTTASSFADWRKAARAEGVQLPTASVCCYPQNREFIAAHVAVIRRTIEKMPAPAPRLLFSAHGLPEKVVSGGDPYQWQVEQTVQAVMQSPELSGLEHVISYQSRVGPLKWIGPSTEDEIRRAGSERRPLVVVPIAFVSEHSETLVELDIEYAELARQHGVPAYHRAPALGDDKGYIEALVNLCLRADYSCSHPCHDGAACPSGFIKCPQRANKEFA